MAGHVPTTWPAIRFNQKGPSMKHTIQLPVATLKTALPGFAKVISTKSYLPALASVRVVRHLDGTVTLHGTDLDSFVRYQVADADSGPPAELLVPLAALRDIIKPCQDDESIDLTRDEDDRVTIGYPAGTTRLSRTFDVPFADDWPAEPEVQPSVPVEDSFKRALREALDCC